MKASAKEALALAFFSLGQLEDARSFKEQALQELVGIDEADASHIRTQIEELPF